MIHARLLVLLVLGSSFGLLAHQDATKCPYVTKLEQRLATLEADVAQLKAQPAPKAVTRHKVQRAPRSNATKAQKTNS
jgi:uncharacterized small protein (DUF1192 family)